MPDLAKTTAVYGQIQNPREIDVSILSASSSLYKRVEFHTMSVDKEGIMRMRKWEYPIHLKPKETIDLERNGTHLMLYDKQNEKGDLWIEIHYSDGKTEKHIVEIKSL
ncbi:copper chaperone PCu(A)C [Leptospira kemamanensis]|uniref:copper chaperone PCu(A)C n=1 Tax=Leptospira kemamanensis TaxID=2484942 RepID=UPI001FC9F469|nr:copper chaperone PCu(A)C [Leptospira kemamanensis]